MCQDFVEATEQIGKCFWGIDLKSFVVEAKGEYRTHYFNEWKNKMGLPGTDFARAAKDVQRTKDHEQIHVDHARAWHDNNKAAIEKAFNTPYQFDTKVEAQAAIDVRLNIWNRKWEAFYAGEIDHTNPGWEGYVQPPLEKK